MKHTITFTVKDDGVENLKFDKGWEKQSAIYKWDHLQDLLWLIDKEYEDQGKKYEKEIVNAWYK